ncbi:MAG: hypothetical protein HONBIEJF_00206 [Fimbriimonadaceae bacterium]|nr:hypothetical protein [Fimbriimonadaceae bacterium]
MTRLHWIAIGTVLFGGTAVALVVDDGSLLLQRTTPGNQQVGHVNVSGRIRAGTFSGVASGLTNIPANALTGTVADARLSSNVAKLGGTQVFTGSNRFLEGTAAFEGFPAFSVTSANVIPNLNVDKLDGNDSTDFLTSNLGQLLDEGRFNLTGSHNVGIVRGIAQGSGDDACGVLGSSEKGAGIRGAGTGTGWGGHFTGGKGLFCSNLVQGGSSSVAALVLDSTTGLKMGLSGTTATNQFGIGIGAGTFKAMQVSTSKSTGNIVIGIGPGASLTEVLRIKGTGNVGIGTNNPGSLLDVDGSVKVPSLKVTDGAAPSTVLNTANAAGDTNWGQVNSNRLSSDRNSLSKVSNNIWTVNSSGDLRSTAKYMSLRGSNAYTVHLNPGTSGEQGFLETRGPAGAVACTTTTYLGGGVPIPSLVVKDGVEKARMYVEFRGFGYKGILEAEEKNFRVIDPEDPAMDLLYTCLEGPEAAMVVRGTAQVVNGEGHVTFPEHFEKLAAAGTVTVTLQPRSRHSRGLGCDQVSTSGFAAFELKSGKGSYSFDWEAKAVRKGYEDYQPVRAWDHGNQPGDKQARWNARLRSISARQAKGPAR